MARTDAVQTINQLLTEMDGFEDNTGVVVMAATNRPAALDNALTRPGRFDRVIHLNLPNLEVCPLLLPGIFTQQAYHVSWALRLAAASGHWERHTQHRHK